MCLKPKFSVLYPLAGWKNRQLKNKGLILWKGKSNLGMYDISVVVLDREFRKKDMIVPGTDNGLMVREKVIELDDNSVQMVLVDLNSKEKETVFEKMISSFKA